MTAKGRFWQLRYIWLWLRGYRPVRVRKDKWFEWEKV